MKVHLFNVYVLIGSAVVGERPWVYWIQRAAILMENSMEEPTGMYDTGVLARCEWTKWVEHGPAWLQACEDDSKSISAQMERPRS